VATAAVTTAVVKLAANTTLPVIHDRKIIVQTCSAAFRLRVWTCAAARSFKKCDGAQQCHDAPHAHPVHHRRVVGP
jgi:hypothetical protein